MKSKEDKTKLCEIEAELKTKSYEVKRMASLILDMESRIKKAILEKDQVVENFLSFQTKSAEMQLSKDKKLCDLTMQLHEKTARLEAFEKLEARLERMMFPGMY